MYEELISEGITDVNFMGINGYQYIDDSYSCMICDNLEACTNCEQVNTIPWAQDYDDGLNCQNENESDCEALDEVGDVWDLWDVSLRDFIILDKQGHLIVRINLTYTNPDPESTCGENYQTIKNLILNAR
ncbi:MAG: hypothetical protein CMG00_07985 [Candidatus Marinimicrobia bacterium]|nr:hypothetical protein [Candidatus Neomarinimicrobiota bacterium]